jgi:hypothetical protein
MKTKMVSYTPETMPRMTKDEVAALKAKLNDPDFKIDYSDIPPMTEEQWKNAKRRRFRQPAGKQDASRPGAKENAARPT